MGEILTYHPTPAELAYTFGGREPLWDISPGDVVKIYTEDCFGGLVRSESDLPSEVCDPYRLNPVSGPFYVRGAEVGDTLAVHFHEITPARTWAVSATYPHFGALTTTQHTAMLHAPLEERVYHYRLDATAGQAWFAARTKGYTDYIPMAPMQGTVGVAPAGGQAITTITSGPHGGNLDVPQIRAGATVYLPVAVPGALLAIGDGHAAQADGEVSGVAIEAAMHTTISVEVLKDHVTTTPRIETDDAILSVGCARPLEDALRISHTDMVAWISDLVGLDQLDALQLLAQGGAALVGQVCNPAYTMLARLPNRFLRDDLPYGGVHQRLRAIPAGGDR